MNPSIDLIIIENEPETCGLLKSWLLEHFPHFRLLEECDDPETGIQAVRDLHPKLLILNADIFGKPEFDFLEETVFSPFLTLFIAGDDRHAVQAIRSHAVDYLEKPLTVSSFFRAISRVERKLSQFPSRNENAIDRISLPCEYGLNILLLKDIVRLEANTAYTNFLMANGEKQLTSRAIGEFEKLLPYPQFVRIHQSHIINLDFVDKFLREDGGKVLLTDSTLIPVSRRRKEDFLNGLKKRSL